MFLTQYLCSYPAGQIKDDKVDFLGMDVESSAATAGQWILLVLGLVFLVTTCLLAYKYRKTRKSKRSLSTMELKQKY